MPSHPVVVYASAGKLLRVYALDTKTGALVPRQTLPPLDNDVHYAAVHPNGKYLYVSCSELPPPKNRPYINAIHAFSIDGQTGALTALGPAYTSPLSRAIHISVDASGRYLLMAHNFAESVSALRLNADGSLGEPVKQPEEQQHLGFLVHQIRVDPSNRWAFVPVRGSDAKEAAGGKAAEPEKPGHLGIFDFHEGVLQKRSVVDYPAGLGPRHLDFHPTKPWIYVSMERGNRILMYEHENGVLKERFDKTTLSDANPSPRGPAAVWQGPSAIHVHPNGKWVYVANRYPPAKGLDMSAKPPTGENSVAVFAIDGVTGEPRLIQNIDTHGITPRTMTLDPTGHFLVVANQIEGLDAGGGKIAPNLSVFGIGDDGKLTYLHMYDQTGGDVWWVGATALP